MLFVPIAKFVYIDTETTFRNQNKRIKTAEDREKSHQKNAHPLTD